jgi:hypothetical protein
VSSPDEPDEIPTARIMLLALGPMVVSAAVTLLVGFNVPREYAAPIALAGGVVALVSLVVAQVPKGFGGRVALFHLCLGATALSGFVAWRFHWWAAMGAGIGVAFVLNAVLAIITDRLQAAHPPSR